MKKKLKVVIILLGLVIIPTYISAQIMPVDNIVDVPTETRVGESLALTGRVIPSDATNRTITWTVINASGTGATINGNMLRATAAGTVTVRATINNGVLKYKDTVISKEFNKDLNGLFRYLSFPNEVIGGTHYYYSFITYNNNYAAGMIEKHGNYNNEHIEFSSMPKIILL